MVKVQSGAGFGYEAKVDKDLRLWVSAKTEPSQQNSSHSKERAFHVSYSQAITNSDVPLIVMTNDNPDLDIVVTQIRMMSIGAAASNVGAYFRVLVGGSYASGGAAVTPVNMNSESAVPSLSTIYNGSSSLSVTGGNEVDLDYTANEMIEINNGTMILTNGTSMSLRHLGSTVAGTAYVRISYYFDDKPGK